VTRPSGVRSFMAIFQSRTGVAVDESTTSGTASDWESGRDGEIWPKVLPRPCESDDSISGDLDSPVSGVEFTPEVGEDAASSLRAAPVTRVSGVKSLIPALQGKARESIGCTTAAGTVSSDAWRLDAEVWPKALPRPCESLGFESENLASGDPALPVLAVEFRPEAGEDAFSSPRAAPVTRVSGVKSLISALQGKARESTGCTTAAGTVSSDAWRLDAEVSVEALPPP
jgi:hypothetical protein